MALKFAVASFPIFVPQKLSPGRPPTEIRFSRWNNANAERFNERRRAQKEIEDDIRRERRFDSAARISQLPDASSPSGVPTFRSAGTPSSPSNPSIPGKKSKYSKPHPAFKKISRVQKTQIDGGEESAPVDRAASVALTEDGVSYIINGAPFEFKYSYTETPKVKPLKLREPPYAPFGPTTMGRPWTGKAPFPPSKKNLPEFDSFKLPPPGKKGVKPVQAPGPYLPGTGPRHVKSREEILGEPLTKAEVMDLLKSCMKSSRQMNMGRDGLTHNMLENIHAHWKRRRVCKIKCKGVCTVDMDNVKQQLEERTGGKIIHSHGGVIYLFRGRNYNYRTRPRFPLMLWRPVTPVYPRLIKRAPEGLTLEEATEMRKKGRQLIPICKLAKNGVYCDLAKNVREAFEECELVRINCQGLNSSDYRKIGAKLKDLVPCVLISFENEYILMWRGRDWKSFLPTPKHGSEGSELSPFAQSISVESEDGISIQDSNLAFAKERELEGLVSSDESTFIEDDKVECSEADYVPAISNDTISEGCGQGTSYHYVTAEEDATSEILVSDENELEDARNIININASNIVHGVTAILEDGSCSEKSDGLAGTASSDSEEDETHVNPVEPDDTTASTRKMAKAVSPATDGVMLLLRQAIENGSALILEEKPLDADIVFRAAVSLAKTAPAGPVFRHGPKRVVVKKADVDAGAMNPTTVNETEIVSSKDNKKRQQKDSKVRRKSDLVVEPYPSVVSHGSLRVDELAKLLA